VILSGRFLLLDTTDSGNSGDIMDPVKIPQMPKTEYNSLIKRQNLSRIAFCAGGHAYIAPFMLFRKPTELLKKNGITLLAFYRVIFLTRQFIP